VKFSVLVTCGHGSVFLWWHCNMLCCSAFWGWRHVFTWWCQWSRIRYDIVLSSCLVATPVRCQMMLHLVEFGWHDVIAWLAWVKPTAGPPWSVTDDDHDRQRQTPAGVTSLAPLHYV